MKKTLLLLAVALTFTTSVLAETREPEGRVLITVGGDIQERNDAAPDPTKLGFFRYLELEFNNGVAFDEAMLAALPQSEIVTAPYGEDTRGTYTGPALSEVLTFVGGEGKTAMPMALDGYQVEIPWETIEKHNPLLATHFNGVPVPVGQLGPALIVFPTVDDTELAEELEALSGFAIVFIGVE